MELKKLCVGGLAILLILVIISAFSGTGTVDSDTFKGSGEYKVGTDIPAGEYYVKCTSVNLYIEVSSDSTGELDSIVYNLNTNGGAYITVEDGQYLTIQGGDIYELDKTPENKTEDGYYKDGMYKVGEDIPAGEYSVEATSGLAYIEVAANSNHQISDIVTNDNFEGTKIITVSDGQYLTLSNGAQIEA